MITLALLSTLACAEPEREEHRVPSDPGISLLVMRVASVGPRRGAVMFMHGAGAGSSSIWDLRFRDYSLMRFLARRGFDSYAVDVRGFGGSTMPPAMSAPASENPPAVRASEAVRDLEAAIRFATKTSSVGAVDLVGWSWGCDVSGLLAGTRPELVRRLVLYAPIWDKKNPKRHRTSEAWRAESKRVVLDYFDPAREERPVWDEHIDAMFRFAGGDELRLPNGPYRDIYGPEPPVWDAARVRAPTLIVRGELDPASVEPHVSDLYRALSGVAEKRMLTIAGASHFLPRERRYRQLQGVILEFLTADLALPR